MSELSTKQRDRLEDSEFAYIDKDGDRHLPIHDEEHVRNAIARFGQTHFDRSDDKRKAAQKIMKAAKKHRIDVAEDDDVARAAK